MHKRTHTFAAVDEAGRELGHKTFEAVTAGHQAAVMWARERFGSGLRWAVEDCRHLSARLERDLVVFTVSAVLSVLAGLASLLRGKRREPSAG